MRSGPAPKRGRPRVGPGHPPPGGLRPAAMHMWPPGPWAAATAPGPKSSACRWEYLVAPGTPNCQGRTLWGGWRLFDLSVAGETPSAARQVHDSRTPVWLVIRSPARSGHDPCPPPYRLTRHARAPQDPATAVDGHVDESTRRFHAPTRRRRRCALTGPAPPRPSAHPATSLHRPTPPPTDAPSGPSRRRRRRRRHPSTPPPTPATATMAQLTHYPPTTAQVPFRPPPTILLQALGIQPPLSN